MLGQAYSLLGFQIVDGVVGTGFPQKPSHSAVFAQIKAEGSRLTDCSSIPLMVARPPRKPRARDDVTAVLTYDHQLQAGCAHHTLAIEAPPPDA